MGNITMSSQAILIIIVIDTRPWPPFDRLAKLGSSSGDQSGRIKVLTLLDLHRSARRGSNFFIHLFCAIYIHFPTCQNYFLTLPNNFHSCQTDFLIFFNLKIVWKKNWMENFSKNLTTTLTHQQLSKNVTERHSLLYPNTTIWKPSSPWCCSCQRSCAFSTIPQFCWVW